MMDIIKEVLQNAEEQLQTYLESMLDSKGQNLFFFDDTDGTHFYCYKRLSDIAVGCKFYILLDEKKNIFSGPIFKIHDRTVTDIKDDLEPNIRYWGVDKTWREGTMQTDRIVCLVCQEIATDE